MKLVECVPNISAGLDSTLVEKVVQAARQTGAYILDVYCGKSTNRSVITMAAEPEVICEAAFAVISSASKLIDMRLHRGHHPRLGATDVCPLIPLKNISIEECVSLARSLSQKVSSELGIPTYLYAAAALSPERKRLSAVRRGQYESLKMRRQNSTLLPDFGSLADCEASGATIIGARDFLIAYNINLASNDLEVARQIAAQIREANLDSADSLKDCHAIGWYLEEQGIAQVSTNLSNFRSTGMWQVYTTVKKLAQKVGTSVSGSELVGLVPEQALLDVATAINVRDAKLNCLQRAVEELGLNQLAPFNIEERVLERRIQSVMGTPI